MKRCTKCDGLKPRTDFYRHGTNNDGLQYNCKSCSKANRRDWRAKNPARSREIERQQYRRQHYGLTEQAYRALLDGQNHCCAICEDTLGVGQESAIDHCHETGCIRGILCRHCNIGLGHFRDDPGRLQAAMLYLAKAVMPSP